MKASELPKFICVSVDNKDISIIMSVPDQRKIFEKIPFNFIRSSEDLQPQLSGSEKMSGAPGYLER